MWIDIGIYAAYLLIILCAASSIIMPLVQSFGDPKSLVKAGLGVAALVVVFVIGYVIADPNAEGTTASTSKFVGAGIITTYVAFAGAIVGILYTEIAKILK